MKLPAAKIPAGISAPIALLITGGMAIAGEADLSHPAHQAVTVVGAFAIAILGYFTVGGTPAIAAAEQTAPPFSIPEPLPVSAVQTAAPSALPASSRAAVDQAAADAASRSLP